MLLFKQSNIFLTHFIVLFTLVSSICLYCGQASAAVSPQQRQWCYEDVKDSLANLSIAAKNQNKRLDGILTRSASFLSNLNGCTVKPFSHFTREIYTKQSNDNSNEILQRMSNFYGIFRCLTNALRARGLKRDHIRASSMMNLLSKLNSAIENSFKNVRCSWKLNTKLCNKDSKKNHSIEKNVERFMQKCKANGRTFVLLILRNQMKDLMNTFIEYIDEQMKYVNPRVPLKKKKARINPK